jgi:hypothetical protein
MRKLSRNTNYIIECQCKKCKEILKIRAKGENINERLLKDSYMEVPDHKCSITIDDDSMIFADIIAIMHDSE